MFAAAGWGWHIETAVHVIRMVLGGVFDRHPKLQVVIGHLGEGIPFMLPRLNKNFSTELTKLKRPVGDYLRENVHYTFGGFNFPATFQNLLAEVGVGADHVLGRSPVGLDGGGAGIPGAASGQRSRPGAHRARQCGEALRVVEGP